VDLSFGCCGESTNIFKQQVAEVSTSFAWPGVSLRSFAAPTSNPPAILEAHAEHRRGLHIYTTRTNVSWSSQIFEVTQGFWLHRHFLQI